MENNTKKGGILQPQKMCDPIVISRRLFCRNLGTISFSSDEKQVDENCYSTDMKAQYSPLFLIWTH